MADKALSSKSADFRKAVKSSHPVLGNDKEQAKGTKLESPPADPYKPKGGTPLDYLARGIVKDDILLGDGLLERGGALLVVGPSGIGKSSIAMQADCLWACGLPAFGIQPQKALRIVMVQHEDSYNDLARQSVVINSLHLSKEQKELVGKNFWIETVRGKIGDDAIKEMEELIKWWKADLLVLNPLSAYHDGNISDPKDNIRFLYGGYGRLLQTYKVGSVNFHHKTKPPKNNSNSSTVPDKPYYETQYDVLGGSVLTNFFRAQINISPIKDSRVFNFTLSKRFELAEWESPRQMFKWHEDHQQHLWVPASVAEAQEAKKITKTLEEFHKLVPPLSYIAKDQLELRSREAGFTRAEFRGLLEESLRDDTPDELRIYPWPLYNPRGAAKSAYSRSEQPESETPQAVKAAKNAADTARTDPNLL